MRRTLLLFVLAAFCLVPGAAADTQATGFAFGRQGGSIRPFRVTIQNSGAVAVTGPVRIGRRKLAPLQLAMLNRLATEVAFAKLPPSTLCPSTLPDVAGTYIRVGATTVRVHGGCEAPYQRLWRALGRAVKLSYT